eukprot:748749-Hanusia_phi.AAC.2
MSEGLRKLWLHHTAKEVFPPVPVPPSLPPLPFLLPCTSSPCLALPPRVPSLASCSEFPQRPCRFTCHPTTSTSSAKGRTGASATKTARSGERGGEGRGEELKHVQLPLLPPFLSSDSPSLLTVSQRQLAAGILKDAENHHGANFAPMLSMK